MRFAAVLALLVSAATAQADTGRLRIIVPADANLVINGVQSQNYSGERVIESQDLEPGRNYYYEVEATVNRGGVPYTERRTVSIEAGYETRLTFNFPAERPAYNPPAYNPPAYNPPAYNPPAYNPGYAPGYAPGYTPSYTPGYTPGYPGPSGFSNLPSGGGFMPGRPPGGGGFAPSGNPSSLSSGGGTPGGSYGTPFNPGPGWRPPPTRPGGFPGSSTPVRPGGKK